MSKPRTRRRTSAIQFSALPPTLADALRRVIHRIRRIILLRGLLATFATLLLALLVVMAVDATTVILNDLWRYLLSGGVLFVTLFTAMRRLVIPLSRPFTPVRIAALIERRHPELEERLSTVVQLLSGEQRFIGSESLFSVVLETACRDVENLDVEEEFTLRTVKPRLAAAGAALAVLIALFVLSPRPAGRLLLRALAPFAEVGNLYAGMLSVTPGDAHVIGGSSLEVTVIAAPTLDGQPLIRFAPLGRVKHESVERMSLVETRADGSRVFRHLVPSVTESFQYRVMSGFAVTRHYQVRSLNRPDVNSIQLQMAFPAYTGQQDLLLTNSLHNLSAIAGTRLTWTATYNRKPMQGEFRFNNISLAGTEISGGGQWATTLTGGGERTWALLLKDAYGYTNNPMLYTLRTRRDAPPQVTIASPEERRIELPRFATLALNCIMVDDFAIVAPSVQWALNDDPYVEISPITSLVATSDPQTWKASVPLELSKFPLSEAKQIRFRVQVSDNLPDYLNGSQKTFSEEIVVVLNHTAKSIAAQIAKAQGEKIEQALKEVDRLLEASRIAAEAFEKKQQEGKGTEDPLEALQKVQENLLKAEALAQKTATEAKQSLYAPIAKELAENTEKNLESALRQAELAMLAEKEMIPEEIRALQEKLKEALEGFRDLQKRNETFAKDLQKLIDLDELAMKEAALSGKVDELEKKLNLAALLEEQNVLRREVKKPLPHEPETYQVMLEAQKEQLDEMKAEAVHLAAEQEQLRKQTEALKDPALREAVAKALAEKAPAAQQEATPEEQARARQADLARRAEALEAKTRKIQESLRDWGQPTARAAQLTEEAARLLNQAKRQSDDAQSKMSGDESVKPKPDLAAAQQEAKLLTDVAREAAKAAERSRQREEEAKVRAENARTEAEKAKEAVRQAVKQAEAVATETQALAEKAGDAAAKSQESLALAEKSAKEANAADAEAHKDPNAPAEMQAEHQARAQEAVAQAAEAARQAQEAAALAREAAAQAQEQAMARADEQRSAAEQKAASEQMKADLEAAQRTLEQLAALQAEQVTQARQEAGEKPGDNAQQRIGKQQQLAEELVKRAQRMQEESAKPLTPAEASPQRGEPNPLPAQAEAQRSLDQAARSLEQAAESMKPLLEQLAKQLGLEVPAEPSAEAMTAIAAAQEKARQAQTRAENLLKEAARPDFSPEQRDQTLDRSLKEQELALGEQKKAEEALAEQQAKSPHQVQEQARTIQQSAKEALEQVQREQTDWKQAQALSKEATAQANAALDAARSKQENEAHSAFDKALQGAREKQHEAAMAQIDAGEARQNRIPEVKDANPAAPSPLPYAMKTEAAMFEAQASWKKLAAMKELEQAAEATTEIQRQALEQVKAAQLSTDPEAMRVAQQQALDKQRKASEALAQMMNKMQSTEAPSEMVQGLKAVQEAQQKATEIQDSAAKAQRDAIRAQQQAQAAQEQARSLAEQAQANPAVQEQAKQAAETATQMEQAAQREAQAARNEQAEVAQAQQQAIRRGSNAMDATETARQAQKENLRDQANQAVETAAATLQRQAQKLAALLGIPLSEMPSANPSHERQNNPQSAESENEKQANSKATQGAQKKDDDKAKDSNAEAKEDEAFEMEELMNPEKKSLFPSWFRFPGFHRGEAEAEGWDDVPAEYRGLVRDYFRKLSEEEDAHE